ncbi:hypothetical protein SAMN05660197_1739 [Nitratiruptor tergarcus DSM 16512]|uniref:DUF234 domain-containing protein n=2 Tax=Nitratiruptor tergarcus TaxID=269259 RepID=A0A1W1WUB4_9BACT|nr:hypothetical protein SAMN05660197_1739 [Nitratiruptor tergarcus DSM 16512]
MKRAFQQVYKYFDRNEVEKAIEFYALFGGYTSFIDFGKPLIHNIEHILYNSEKIAANLQIQNEHLLSLFATGDRKIDSAIKKSYTHEREGYKNLQELFNQNLIKREVSREKFPQKTHPKQKLKKHLRRYRIQNKIRFQKPFLRFWYRYIYPSFDLIIQHKYDKVMEFILGDLDNFVSLTFEELSNELLLERFPEALSSGSYWDHKVEIDILLELPHNEVIVGECKWKNSKICKKTLTALQKKSAIAGFTPKLYALFSKSSFSNELLKSQDKNLLLFDLEDFKEWSEKKAYKKREKKPYSFEF